MKRFILISILFISPIIWVVFFSLMVNSLIINDQALKIPEHKRILILGDSNPECAINDSIIKHFINLSQSANSYFYNYLKLRQILSNSSSIDTVILGLAPHNIFVEIEEEWLLNSVNMGKMIHDYYPLMEKDDFAVLLNNNREGVTHAISSIIKGSIKNIVDHLRGKKSDYGGYLPLERNDLNMALPQLKNKNRDFEIAKIETLYINKIIDECKKNNIDLLFINTPKRIELWGSKRFEAAHFYSYYSKYFSDIPLLDFHDFYIPDYGFGDLEHLNLQGARIFSEYIEKLGITQLTELHKFNVANLHDSNTSVNR